MGPDAEPVPASVETSLPPERILLNQYVEMMVRQNPDGLVTNILIESLPEGVSASRYLAEKFDQEGFVPKGETLTLVREILEAAPVKQERSGGDRVIKLDELRASSLSRERMATDLFLPRKGRGLELSMSKLGQYNLAEDQWALLYQLRNFRAGRLLLGLYAAGYNSEKTRKARGSWPQTRRVLYCHRNGQVSLIELNDHTAGQLTRMAEDAIIAAKGTL